MKIADITGVYDTDRDNEKLVTKKGNPYAKVLVKVKGSGDVVYDAFFFTEKAYWTFDNYFKACGATTPEVNWSDIDASWAIVLQALNSTIGSQVSVNIIQNQAGYDTVQKYEKGMLPELEKEADSAPLTDDVSGQLDDDF